jgi:Flp pilus assembly protein TadG
MIEFCDLIRRARSEEGGFVVVLVAISMTAIVVIAGFAIDVGAWYLQASKLQRASDAAALAGAMKLPDTAAADAAARYVYASNGFPAGPDLSITNDLVGGKYVSQARLRGVNAIFAKGVLDSVTINRKSAANQPTDSPALGSPYNVLGVGDNDVAGVTGIPEQNFWLAVNGQCASKEDGDYFTARYDNNKGPTTGARSGNDYVFSGSATHACSGGQTNQARGTVNTAFNNAGYSYYVDIPKAAVSGGQTVSVKIYDPGYDDFNSNAGDYNLSLGGDSGGYVETYFRLLRINDPANQALDTEIVARNYGTYDLHPNGQNGWANLYTFNNSDIPAEGGRFRVQVMPYFGWDVGGAIEESRLNSVNAFALGAFRGSGFAGCDTRGPDKDWCPNVYGRGAVSAYNLVPASGSTAKFYLADLTGRSVDSEFDVFLWDPGEGVDRIDLVGPGDVLLPFRWEASASTNSGATASTGETTELITNLTLADPAGAPQVSNNYVYNDRLVKLRVRLPPAWATLTGPDRWVAMRYHVGAGAQPDRTTWGVSVGGKGGSPPHLVFAP